MQATGKVNSKVMDELSVIFSKCLIKSVADIRTDVIESLTMPLLTGDLQGKALPWNKNGIKGQHVTPNDPDKVISIDSISEVRLISTAPYSEQLYKKDKLHQTVEAHLDNDMCLDKAEQAGGVRANPYASGHWYDTYLDGDKSDFAKERFSEHLKKELNK